MKPLPGSIGRDSRSLSRDRRAGFTLIEIVFIVLILGILAALGNTVYTKVVNRARIVQSVGDIRAMAFSIDDYFKARGVYPETLASAGMTFPDDPWGNPYTYTPLSGGKNKGHARKDHNLVPLNTDYDLFSSGPDGESVPPLTGKASRDDIVRGNDGGYVGLAESY